MIRIQNRLIATILGVSVLAACGGGDGDSQSRGAPRNSSPEAGAPENAPSEDSEALVVVDPTTAGTVNGTVRFTGTAPTRRPIPMGGNPDCDAMHTEPLLTETVIVNENGTLRNVFVYVRSGLPSGRFDPPAEAAALTQHGCQYIPHVQGVIAGQTINIENDDALLHNVHMRSQRNRELNFSQPNRGQVDSHVFRFPEIMVEFSCDVHSWMKSYVAVVAHPYFAVTGEDGSFTLANVPPGTYTVTAWHERYGTQDREVTIADGGEATVEFSFTETEEP